MREKATWENDKKKSLGRAIQCRPVFHRVLNPLNDFIALQIYFVLYIKFPSYI